MPRHARVLRCLAFGVLLAAGASAATAAGPTGEEAKTASEANVKAAFLYNFVKYVEWPPDTALGAAPRFALGVLGDNTLATLLEGVIAGKTVAGRPLVVLRFTSIDDVQPCHLLFVAASKTALIAEVLGRLGGAPVLTVGEAPGFARAGGIVNFYDDDRRLRFEVNPETAARAGLKVSSHLLSLARILKDPGKKP